MVAVVSLGLSAALIYGASDFLGGFAAGRLSALGVTLLAFLAGLVVSLAFLPFVVSALTIPALIYGAIAGVAAAASIWLLYSCLPIGPYSPGGRGTPVRPRALLLGIAAGLGTGGYLIALDYTPPRSGAVPIVVVFIVGSLLLALVAAAGRLLRSPARAPSQADPGRPPRQRHTSLILAVISGMTQAVADVMAVIGIHWGDLAVMAALLALYPLGTIVLALIINRERPTRLQIVGIALAVAASVALSAG